MKKLGIMAIYLFGSRAEGAPSFKSDIDIGIILKDTSRLEDTRYLYKTIYNELSNVFPRNELDIVFLQKAPVPLQYNAITSGRALYEDDPVTKADYEQDIINKYLDFKPMLDYIDSIALRRHVA